MPTELEGAIFDANTGEKLGYVPKTVSMSFDNLHVREVKEPAEKVRETRMEWTEGEDYRTLNLETFLTFREIRKLVKDVMA